MSVVYGKAMKYFPIVYIYLFAALINIAVLIMSFFGIFRHLAAIFAFAVLWGAADGVWNTMTTSE
jgi:hypothetical protein